MSVRTGWALRLWGIHPSQELAIPQHPGVEIEPASDEGCKTHTHTQRITTGGFFTHSEPNPDIFTARGGDLNPPPSPSMEGVCSEATGTELAVQTPGTSRQLRVQLV